MLVLSRKRSESVVVGGSAGFERMFKVTVLQICGGMVRLGFEVDADVPVHRLEIWERFRAGILPESPRGSARLDGARAQRLPSPARNEVPGEEPLST
jgi:carbon storage regulator CsrA